MTSDSTQRAIDKIARLTGEARDLAEFWRECTEVIGTVVPYYWTPCWYTLDPASLLITSHYHHGLSEFPADWLAHEYYGDDVNKIADIAVSEAGVATLREATGGDPTSSPRYHINLGLGGEQEIITRLRTASGQVWGALGLYREPGRALFDDTDKRLLRALSPHLAEGARRALLIGEATEPDTPNSPGLVILDQHWNIASTTPGTERWLAELPDPDHDSSPDSGRAPPAVLAVAGRARRIAEHPTHPAGITVARVRSRSGSWLVLHGAVLRESGQPRTAIIIEAAQPARIFPLLMSAYHLTTREQDITHQVLHGASTAQIARELHMSPHTVQQHLKGVFDKTGVRSRPELVGRIFFTHYEPRFRDNERRTTDNRPMRGGPAALNRNTADPPPST
ncbi:helix-turn-helix transcriptional regulator [Actinomycetospora flava]|uniref:Helix-turn-helix transcriptional regulator n=1 Tax=Actinomycetospora flava TaxID=3129232 RepID=A0ABU8MEL4_9PSEU